MVESSAPASVARDARPVAKIVSFVSSVGGSAFRLSVLALPEGDVAATVAPGSLSTPIGLSERTGIDASSMVRMVIWHTEHVAKSPCR